MTELEIHIGGFHRKFTGWAATGLAIVAIYAVVLLVVAAIALLRWIAI